MDRDKFFAELDQLTPTEIEARLPFWEREKLELVQEYFTKRPQPIAPRTKTPERMVWSVLDFVTERTVVAALIALGLILAALILRGGYEVAASSVGAYVVNRFTGTTWQCLNTCVRLESGTQEKK
jgi:hypothetical protein